ncbi:MAG: MFS transporter [Patescibacteria group bacterium]|nr:MFS transporter [Patescibacteria group bacterium]
MFRRTKLFNIKWIHIITFVFSLHIAISAYINSSFLSEIISEEFIGFLFTISSLIILFFFSRDSKILRYYGNRKLTLLILLVNLFSLTGLIVSKNPYIIVSSFVLFITTNSLFFFCVDIFIKHFGNPRKIGKIRGLHLTIVKFAWMLSPLIAITLISKFNYIAVYVVAFFVVILTIAGLMFSIPKFTDKSYVKTPYFRTYRLIRKRKHLFAITFINFILQIFYVLMIIYSPIYLNKHLGLSWEKIGLIFTAMLSPFIIIPYLVGFLIDKNKLKKRNLLNFGLIIMGLSTMFIAIISTKAVLVWIAILFITRIGASIIESISDIYFFDFIEEKETHLLGFYRNMFSLAFLIGPIIGSIIIIFLSFKYLFVFTGLFILVGLFYTSKLKINH